MARTLVQVGLPAVVLQAVAKQAEALQAVPAQEALLEATSSAAAWRAVAVRLEAPQAARRAPANLP